MARVGKNSVNTATRISSLEHASWLNNPAANRWHTSYLVLISVRHTPRCRCLSIFTGTGELIDVHLHYSIPVGSDDKEFECGWSGMCGYAHVRSSGMKTPNVCTSLCWHGYCFAGKRVQSRLVASTSESRAVGAVEQESSRSRVGVVE